MISAATNVLCAGLVDWLRPFAKRRHSALSERWAPPIWKRIRIGGTSDLDLVSAIKARYMLDPLAANVMLYGHFDILPRPEDALLIVLTPAAFGFQKVVWGEDLFAENTLRRWSRDNSEHFELSLCPPEVGPHLRLDYDEQARRTVLWIAMRPIPDGRNIKRVFYLERKGFSPRTCGLGAIWTQDPGDGRWQPDQAMVFRLQHAGGK